MAFIKSVNNDPRAPRIEPVDKIDSANIIRASKDL
jgi:hypothetical protein